MRLRDTDYYVSEIKKSILYSTGKYSHCFVITSNGIQSI